MIALLSLASREVAVGAGLGLGAPHGVREMRREGLARKARGRDRRLLDVDPLAVDVGRGQDQRRGRADRGDDVALAGLVAAELEHVVARDLRVVGREVARLLAFIMVGGGAPVRLDRQVAAAAARRPAQVAGEAGHLAVGMGELAVGRRRSRTGSGRSRRRLRDISLARAERRLKQGPASPGRRAPRRAAGSDRRCRGPGSPPIRDRDRRSSAG